MKKKLFITYFFLVVSALLLFTNIAYSQKLYFCEKYIDGNEIGVSDKFKVSSNVVCITVMYSSYEPINVGCVNMKIYRIDYGNSRLISSKNWDIKPEWEYIYFEDVEFKKPGVYRVSLETKNNILIATALVEITFY